MTRSDYARKLMTTKLKRPQLGVCPMSRPHPLIFAGLHYENEVSNTLKVKLLHNELIAYMALERIQDGWGGTD